MFLILSIIVILVVLASLLNYYGYFKENFEASGDMLFTANPVQMMSSDVINSAPRHVKFNKARGIDYISMHPPRNAKRIICPKVIDRYVTLGDVNYCWV